MKNGNHRIRWGIFWRVLLIVLALAGGTAITLLIERTMPDEDAPLAVQASGDTAFPDPAARDPMSLEALATGKLRIVDLGWPLSEKSAYWPGENYHPFKLETIATPEKDGVLSKAFSTPEHLGTHLDAPNHFEPNQPSVDQIPPEALFAPGVVLDVTGAASSNDDYEVSVTDIEKFEAEHGRIPDRAVVLAWTDWSKFWENPTRYQNRDARGQLHFPGYSREAADFLIRERNIRGLGIDTLSVDPGASRDFPVHHLLGKAARYGLENVANLEKLPPRGFYVFVAPLAIETGTGSPIRLLAILP